MYTLCNIYNKHICNITGILRKKSKNILENTKAILQNCCSWVIKTCKDNITWKEVGKLTIFGKNWERSGN